MSLQLARSRRLDALKKCNSDRQLVAPVDDLAELSLPKAESVAAELIDALGKGATAEQLAAEMQWSKPRLMANLYRVAKKTGVGIQRRDDRLEIVWPDGFEAEAAGKPKPLDGEVMTEAEYTRAA